MTNSNDETAPDVSKLLARADDDIERGEAWRARQRLRNYASQFKSEPRFAARLGEMLLEIGEIPDAEKMLCRGCSLKEEHQPLITAYLEKKTDKNTFRSAIRRSLLHASRGTPLSPAIVQAIESRGLVVQDQIARAVAKDEKKKTQDRSDGLLFNIGCTVALGLLILTFGLGVKSLIELVERWLS